MSVKSITVKFQKKDFVYPKAVYATYTFNGQGTSLNYYIEGKDSQGYCASLKLDFFENKVRFTNYKKPHPAAKYELHFDKFTKGWSCSYEEIKQGFQSSTPLTVKELNQMAEHWEISVERFINTLLLAYELLMDAEYNHWIGDSMWEGGDFLGFLPPRKR